MNHATGPACPEDSELEALSDGAADEAVSRHVDACEVCRGRLAELKSFEEEVRAAADAGPGVGGSPAPGPMPGYTLLEEIQRGGQGVVYRALQTATGRTVAIKVVRDWRAGGGRQRERFEREVRIAAGLRHPNIVTVHDSGAMGDGRYGLVMEHIDGLPLDRWSHALDAEPGRDARRRALRRRLGVMVKVCDAVLCAHQRSIVHRDLKPANILVDAADEPHVLDFGIAREIGPDQHTRLTLTGEFAGTLAYASPEQISGDPSRVDTRTDVYSLGVILYELLSGKMPYPVDGPVSRVVRSIESAEPVPLARRTRGPQGPWVDGEVSTIVLKAMAKDPARRYQTAAALRDDLARYLAGEAIEARRDSTWYVLRKTAARHRVAVAAAALIVALLAVFGGAMAWQASRLAARGRELSAALSDSNVERGRTLTGAGDVSLAMEVLWPELIGAGVTKIEGPGAGYSGSPAALRAYWALWDAFRRSSCLAMLRTHGKEVQLLYFDEGGSRLNALDAAGGLVSWSAATWETVRDTSLVGAVDGAALQYALAPDGRIAVFGGGALRVVDPGSGAVVAHLDDPDEEARIGAFSPDGTLLATVGRDQRLRLRESRTLQTVVTTAERASCRPHPWSSRPVFAPDGRLVAAVRPNGSLGLWDAASGALERTLQPPQTVADSVSKPVVHCSIALAPDGTVAASMDYSLVVWPADGGAARDLGARFGIIRSVAFLPGGRLVSSGNTPGGGGAATSLWSLETGAEVATFQHADEVFSSVASPDARLLAVGGEKGTVRVLEAAPEPHVRVLHAADGGASVAAVSPDGRVVALTAEPGGETGQDVLLIDLASGATIARHHRERWSGAIAFSPDGSSLFEGDETERNAQWDLSTGATRREFVFPDPPERGPSAKGPPAYSILGYNQMRLSADGATLARARDDGLIGLWDVPSGRWIDWLDGGSPGPAVIDFSADGATLAARYPEACVLWDVPSRRPRLTLRTARQYPTVRMSAGGLVAHGAPDGLRVFDAATGRLVSETKDPRSDGLGRVFHPGGPLLCASAYDQSVRLWDARTGRELLSLHKHADLILSVQVTPDGNTLISADRSGMVLAWDLAYYNGHVRRELAWRVAHPPEK